jgi:sugar phosphate isomerase/epimerase
MEVGIFAKTFPRATFEETLAAVQAQGLVCVQFNLACAGLDTVPEAIDPGLARRVREEFQRRGMIMAALSGTCNLIHPDRTRRAKCLANLAVLIRACGDLGTSMVTLCSGTRDPEDMWRGHPENHSPEAWRDLVESIESLLPMAQEAAVTLGIEPEPANVIDSAESARKLLDELRSGSLKIVFDAANLVGAQNLGRQREILDQAADLLGPDIALAHAKDLAGPPQKIQVPAGRGELDYEDYVSALRRVGFDGALILHSLRESEVAEAVAFLRAHLGRARLRSQD